jgi:isoleucyl-tRNA synthetase
MSEAVTKKNYKDTLNLPRTRFDMRANLAQNEPLSQKRWDAEGLYNAVLAAREAESAPPYYFHDGPPYANGSIHVGHLLNKVLKDLVVRTRLMAGFHTPYVPGWDCHGLPIEHKVVQELLKAGKMDKINELPAEKRHLVIRSECKKSAEKFIKLQAGQMQRLLTLADYADPYLTMAPRFEREVLGVFARLVEEGIVYRDLKPVHWSIANQTALAEAELEYQDREDTSVFVTFEAVDSALVASAFGVDAGAPVSFMIWTTTPWTLPANLAVAVHPRYTYVLARLGGKLVVLAKELAEKVAATGGVTAPEVLAEAPGEKLLSLEYRHPFVERVGRVVGAEYVTLEDGTGLVHTAPGHGAEDYQTGLREGLEVYCPVKGDGTYDETVPEWLQGQSIWDANEMVVERLKADGNLFHANKFLHSYPHDWRSKTPVIFRATEQWFVGVEKPLASTSKTLREMALGAVENDVDFVPGWGRNRLRGMLETRPDWCISRQRSWGLPIPAFTLPDGGTFLTAASVRAVAEAFGKRGSDAWFAEEPAKLLETYDAAADPQAPAGLDVSTLKKGFDIFDVWFESGSSWQACMRRRGYPTPVDLYLEGSDQHRGWFQLSLLPALGATAQPPFKKLLTHGFMVDKEGKKLSKSSGNALEVETLLKDFGADICRWWVSSVPYENDIKLDLDYFKSAADGYRKVRNTLRFLLSNLFDFNASTNSVPLAALDPAGIDAWALKRAAEVQKTVLAAFETFEFRKAHLALFDFCNDDLSAFYCATVKDRLYCDKPDSARRRTTQTVMHVISDALLRLLAPIMPHTADEAWREFTGSEKACVHLEKFAQLPETAVSEDWPLVLKEREKALKAIEDAKARGIENRLDAGVVFTDPKLGPFVPDLADLLGVSRASVDAAATEISVRNLTAEPRCERSWKRDGTVKPRSDGTYLSDRDAEAVGLA